MQIGSITSSTPLLAAIMPASVDRTLHRRHKTGFKRVLQEHRAAPAMFYLLTQSPSIYPVVTWRFIGGRLIPWVASIPNIIRLAMMLTFAGAFSRPAG